MLHGPLQRRARHRERLRPQNLEARFGHDVGDMLLKEVARRLSACARAGDTISRQAVTSSSSS